MKGWFLGRKVEQLPLATNVHITLWNMIQEVAQPERALRLRASLVSLLVSNVLYSLVMKLIFRR